MRSMSAKDGLSIEQILSSDGFTLDTTDFPDLLDEDEELDYTKSVQLNNQEMLRLLNLEEDNDDKENVEIDNTAFIGISFDTIKPKMHSIYGDGEILKLIKRQGVGEIVPKDAQVTVEYVGYFEYQDEPFDSTLFHREKRSVLRLGSNNIIQGLEIAISSMRKYEKALFLIQPHLAYGKLGCLPRIPPDSEVLFKVELINFLDNGSAELYEELSNEEKKQFRSIEKIVRDLMNTAMDSFSRQKIKQAIREYNRAVIYLESARLENDEEEINMNKLLSRALSNLTVCYNKVNKPKLVCISFQKLPSKNGKAYFQYGKALEQLGEYDEAMSALQRANQLLPGIEPVRKEIQKVEESRNKYMEFSRRFAQNSLRIANNQRSDEFEQVAIEMCNTFVNDTTALKQQIPHGLSVDEIECIRRIAASRGLVFTKQKRYDVEATFLTKPSFYSKELI